MSNKAKIREDAKKLNPIDDLMFRKMAEDKEFCQEILRVILEDDGLVVLESIPQWSGTNLQGRSVILDAKCLRGDGTHVDIEIQQADNDDHQRRVRYNGAVLTTNVANPGITFDNIPNVCVVYITTFDIFSGGFPIYHVDRVVRETRRTVENGFEEIYVNTVVKDGSDVSELMEIFVNGEAYNDKYPKTSGSKRLYKETERGLDIMCSIMENLTNEARAEGKAEGKAEGIVQGKAEGIAELLIGMVKDGILTMSEAAKRAGMSEAKFAENMSKFNI